MRQRHLLDKTFRAACFLRLLLLCYSFIGFAHVFLWIRFVCSLCIVFRVHFLLSLSRRSLLLNIRPTKTNGVIGEVKKGKNGPRCDRRP